MTTTTTTTPTVSADSMTPRHVVVSSLDSTQLQQSQSNDNYNKYNTDSVSRLNDTMPCSSIITRQLQHSQSNDTYNTYIVSWFNDTVPCSSIITRQLQHSQSNDTYSIHHWYKNDIHWAVWKSNHTQVHTKPTQAASVLEHCCGLRWVSINLCMIWSLRQHGEHRFISALARTKNSRVKKTF